LFSKAPSDIRHRLHPNLERTLLGHAEPLFAERVLIDGNNVAVGQQCPGLANFSSPF
jgi:hypothetical protein